MNTNVVDTTNRAEQHPAGIRTREAGQSLTSFFLLAFLLSWLVEVPLALKAQGILQLPLPFAVHYLAGYSPMVAALFLTAKDDGWPGIRRLFRRMFRWHVPAVWWLIAFSPLLFYALLVAVLGWLKVQPPALSALGQLKFLPDLGFAALPFWVITFGLGEEAGWRGYALPRLQRTRGALSATIILWFFWALWHLPLFFYTYDAGVIFGFVPGLLAGAIVFTWLFNSTGSILIAAVWHGMFDLTTACATCGTGMAAAAVSMLVMVGAVALLVFYEPLALGKRSRQSVWKRKS
jgi:membrane protease YdiL (CAAX protease family)